MLSEFAGRFWTHRSRRAGRGSLMPMFAVMAVPVMMSVGVGVDMTRVVLARADLQGAVDGAALAAATAAGSQTTAASASTVATNVATTYFNSAGLGPSVAITPGTLTITAQTSSATPPTYTVAVSASATMATTFLKVLSAVPGAASYSTMPLAAHAKASNPSVPGSSTSSTSSPTTYQPVITIGRMKSSSWDWNSAYLYIVPADSNGVHYDQYPAASTMYEIGSNCSWRSGMYQSPSSWGRGGSLCNDEFQPTVPAGQTLPVVTPDQVLAILFVNQTGGLTNYGGTFYGAKYGYYNLFSTAAMSSTSGPAGITNTSATVYNEVFPAPTLVQPKTAYTSGGTSVNCSVIIQQIDPGNPPSNAPSTGSCFSPTDSASGAQFANLTCGQMAGRTFMYWWNDMGGTIDDKDYNDFWFSLTCTPGATSTNGGTISSGTTTTTANAQNTVTLIQ